MRRLVLLISIVLVSATGVAGKEWRGFFPMHSTRADVERVFGRPQPAKDRLVVNRGRWVYLLDQEEIHFVFAEGNFPSPKDCVVPIADGTILMIYVTPKTEAPISSLQIDETKFTKFNASFEPLSDQLAYINEEEGLLIQTYKGKVTGFIYAATAMDRRLCPGYYGDLRSFVTPVACGLNFDSYGNLRFSDEKARLDNFAIQLMQLEANGYIIVYAGRKATVNEAQLRANRAKNYLVQVRGLKSERLYAVDGGYNEEIEIKLYVAPPGSPPPPLMPALDRSQVEIQATNKHKKQKR